MNYSAQQLSGGVRYTKAKTGNWFEDECLAECKMREFKNREDRGELVLDKLTHKNKIYNRPIQLSISNDAIRYGDIVQIVHVESQTTLACDPSESLYASIDEMKLVTASARCEPVARNTFRIEAISVSNQTGDLLHYGESFYLVSDFSMKSEDSAPLFLASTLKNERIASRLSNQQAVYMVQKPSSSTVWTFEKIGADPGIIRQLAMKESIPPRTPIVIQHRATKQALCADTKLSEITHFGSELEVSCQNHFPKERVAALVSEHQGRSTPGRLENSLNYWFVNTQT